MSEFMYRRISGHGKTWLYPLNDVLEHYGFSRQWWKRMKQLFADSCHVVVPVAQSAFGRGNGRMTAVNKPVIKRIARCAAWRDLATGHGFSGKHIRYSDHKLIGHIAKEYGCSDSEAVGLVIQRSEEVSISKYSDLVDFCLSFPRQLDDSELMDSEPNGGTNAKGSKKMLMSIERAECIVN